MLRLLREAAERTALPVAARHRRLRRGKRIGVAVEHVRDSGHVVEPDQRVGDDEAALRQVGPVVRQRYGRFELRDVVVPVVADDREAQRFGLVQVDEASPRADERVPPEAAVFDRLQQERAAPFVAQPEVRPERG